MAVQRGCSVGPRRTGPGTTSFFCFPSQRHPTFQPCIPRTPCLVGNTQESCPSGDSGIYPPSKLQMHRKAVSALAECSSDSVTVPGLDFTLDCIHCRAKQTKPLNLCNTFFYQRWFDPDKILSYCMLNARSSLKHNGELPNPELLRQNWPQSPLHGHSMDTA